MTATLQHQFAIGQSVVFHGLIAFCFWVSVPYLSRDLVIDQPVLTVELLDIAPVTNLDEGIKAAPPEKPPEVARGERERIRAPAPPAPQRPAEEVEALPEAAKIPEAAPERPEEVAEAAPEPPEQVAEPAPEKPEEQAAEAKPDIATPPIPPAEQATDSKRRQEQQIALNKALEDLTIRQIGRPDAEKEEEEQKPTEDEKKNVLENINRLAGQALNVQRQHEGALGVSAIDLVRNHIHKFWNPPAGATGADAIVFVMTITLNTDAEVVKVELKDRARYGRDPFFTAAVDAARRAVVEASPLPLPLDQYEVWKSINFTFDPRFIAG